MSTMLDSPEMDKLSYEIFSILENKFLFGGYNHSSPQTPIKAAPKSEIGIGKIRILSIDGGEDGGLLAAVSLSRIESSLRSRDPNARIADFFDVVAGSGVGGGLAAMLFSRSSDGRPLYSADEALRFLVKNRGLVRKSRGLKGMFQKSNGIFRQMFGESTLRDTVKPVLIPCYDLSTGAPFLFSRADAIGTDGYNFIMSDVCAATCTRRAVKMRSTDGKTEFTAVSGGLVMKNPTAAAITHVLNNKQEFPSAHGVEDLLVISLGDGGGDSFRFNGTPSRAEMLRIAENGAADAVDEAVAMAFGRNVRSNYVRIQASGFLTKRNKAWSWRDLTTGKAEDVLSHRNVESVLFQGKKISEQSNGQKLDRFCNELIKEEEKRKSSVIPIATWKQAMTPRSSSATISTTFTGSTATTSP